MLRPIAKPLYKKFTLAAFSAQLAISVIKDPVNLDLSLISEIEGGGCTVLFEAYGRNRDTCYTS